MKGHTLPPALPESYFDGKDGTGYRFTILKDIAVAGQTAPVPYDESQRGEILANYEKFKDFALYVHFPWCVEHCSYCHYYRGPMLKRTELENMMKAERAHLKMIDDHIDIRSRNVPTIYFGGGTPTVIPADLLEEALAYYVDNFASDGCEVCVESSILTLRPKKVEILERYVTRLSVGVQSFDDDILKIVERKHTAQQCIDGLKDLVPRFPSVNVDLIYGLYDQNLDQWLSSVQTAIDVNSQSVTAYRLDIRERPAIMKLFRKEPEKFPDEALCRRMYEDAKKMLIDAGYRENLVGWFLKPEVPDTIVYRERWEKQSPCIGLGPALHNYAADHFYETIADHNQYIAAVEAGKLPIANRYPLDSKKQLIWYVLAQLKSNSPIYKTVMTERFGNESFQWFMGLVKNYIGWSVLKDTGDKLELNEDHNYILEWMLVELIGSLNK